MIMVYWSTNMAEIQPQIWGAIVSLNREEACFASRGLPEGEGLIMAAVPQPWGTLVVALVKLHKFLIGANVGTNGVDLHINWGGFLHHVARRGDLQACS
jgi:hypothetical protein